MAIAFVFISICLVLSKVVSRVSYIFVHLALVTSKNAFCSIITYLTNDKTLFFGSLTIKIICLSFLKTQSFDEVTLY